MPPIVGDMALADELERAAALAAAHVGDGDVVSGVLATEPEPGRRVYLCSIDGADGTRALARRPRGRLGR